MKLLNRTIRNYIIFSALLFVSCTPVFYLAIQRLFVHELDNVLLSHRKDFTKSIEFLRTENDLVYYHMMNKEFILTPVNTPIERDSLFTIESYDSLHNGLIPLRTFISGVYIHGKPYQLKIQESMVSSRDLIKAIVGIQAGLLLFLFAGLVFINRKLSRVIWLPFYNILERLKAYEIDKDASIELPHSTTAEFRDLSLTITQLISRNKSAYQSQKEFTENASHEIQTPLAVLTGKLDLLMQTNLTEQQAELIGVIHTSALRLSRLNRNLLLLAKIENNQFQSFEEVDIELVLTNLIRQFEDGIQQKELSILYSLPPQPGLLNTNKALFEILISNLVSNSIRYAPAKSTITIDASVNHFTISNRGERLVRPEVVFDRFTRENTHNIGTGLGLAIAKKISDQLNFTLRYEYTDATHHFLVTFKK